MSLSKKQRITKKREIIRNRKLCKQYPWLRPFRRWYKDKEQYGWGSGEKYSYIMWDFWPPGWNKAFGQLFLEELGIAVKKAGWQNIFHIHGGKEKYGRCVLEYSPYDETIDRIVSKYEILSENICIYCGKPDVPMLNIGGWYEPICRDCYKWRDYDRAVCSSPRMDDSYTIRRNNTEEVVNTRPTADLIRKRYYG